MDLTSALPALNRKTWHDNTFARLLDSRGLKTKPGTSWTGGAGKSAVHIQVVDRITGEDRGERWIKFTGKKFEVLRIAPPVRRARKTT
jgi:hypothetical protein